MSFPDVLARGRDAYQRRVWGSAYALLFAADSETTLGVEDLERLAIVAHLIGKDEESAGYWARAHDEAVRVSDVPKAARCAFWLGFGLINLGDFARGGGWIARANRLLDESTDECVEAGYLLLPAALQTLESGDFAGALGVFRQVFEIASRFDDGDLKALGLLGQGRALLGAGDFAKAVALLDEAMIAVTTNEASPIIAGTVYCAVIEACREIFDLRRAREWTHALDHWCESQPDLVPYRGECLVYRAEILKLQGAWTQAVHEVQRACALLTVPPEKPAAGPAFYQLAELHRLQGSYAEAQEAYRKASQWGMDPEPGLALMRLAQGEVKVAASAISRAVDESSGLKKSRLLAAFVEILLAAKDTPNARSAAEELLRIGDQVDALQLHAAGYQAMGAVLLSEGDPRSALADLRSAYATWIEIKAPYEAARTRELIGLCLRELGDHDSAELELSSALFALQQLGAAPDARRLETIIESASAKAHGLLTSRELQVLRLVSDGRTNRAIARELVISEKTVARHLSNIFLKLGVESRTAAAAYFFGHPH